ncbi:TonB-dependent receptor [Roseateles flavus]|uniref:TonB-dependent receptor n=1 Tax=Roseateles flavus TaxID=3149041 RepID=A0ABV0GE39_9BURK
MTRNLRRRHLVPLSRLAAACAVLIAPTLQAQTAEPAKKDEGAQLDTVVITGIRKSLDSSLDLKRKAQGVVDGIVAEDIGKFPDTNLAESMQRIAGVSIDRANGEGSRVTVRGVGPDFNLVLLNGRQMPAANLADTTASNARSFDFANLASEGVAALEVYKTGRSENPTGGIGATINIKTARPLDNPKTVASFGAKLVSDDSNKRLPGVIAGSQNTPELSGIYSQVFADGTFGIALSGSLQKRNSGYNQAGVPNGWYSKPGNLANANDWTALPLPNEPGGSKITNRPKPTDLYEVPQNLMYSMNGIERTRTNGQLVLQYRPMKDLTLTLDKTYSENKIHTKRSELSAWFNFAYDKTTWADGPIASPLIFSELYTNGPADVAMGGAYYGTKNKNDSTGFNAVWRASERLKLELDAHHSVATAGADSPYGTNNALGVSMQNRASDRVDFSGKFPVLGIGLSGNPADSASLMQVTGSSFRNAYMRNAIDQAQIKGKYTLSDASNLDFGVGLTKVNNRTAFANVQQNDWGGHNKPSDYADTLWQADTIQQYFSRAMGSVDRSAMVNNFFVWDFNAVRDAAVKADGSDKWFKATDNFDDDRRTQERSTSAFVQYSADFDWGVPMSAALGLRYERTKVDSQALVPIATGIQWVSANEFAILKGAPGFTSLSGKYSYLLPSIDWEAELSSQWKVRASFGESIGRPGWDKIQGGQTLTEYRAGGGTGNQGNPGLKPLLSKNFDFSAEYYYAKSSYAAIGIFRKNISNYIGTSVVPMTPFSLTSPINGALFKEAAASCGGADLTCVRNYLLNTYNGRMGIVKTGVDGSGNALGTIAGQSGDPMAVFNISVPTNQRSDHINGLELNVQHAFGRSGFGLAANYTYVRSGLKFKDDDLQDQNALVGLSNSANLVGFYEDDRYSVRMAYNWRGEFLNSTNAAVNGGSGPSYTEPYGQWDLSIGYKYSPHLSFQFEAINLNDGVIRTHGRTRLEVQSVTQTGRRFMVGARYTF